MASTSHPPVIVYTTPTCPDCHTLKAWLGSQGIAFEERDLTLREVMEEAKARTGVRVAPITVVGDAFFYGTFLKQKPLLAAALGLSGAA
ncbi:glutaredoxin family protein [Stenotrophomonas rhizophila]|uniref:glutaredoxin family protein n=1 Tax=Stenotrophomonas rhizophila TaxID=216778 RepID=UPI001E3C22D2|nr:glutaredoxin family protein [Stenotrophomonas rhizophila]MCC7635384.1 glutaredoxin family protein [Stenotrophomonas rhizophila]MCC7664387.1 glutaredoxin family protein [Stenotrophomonas rhizophila]